MTKWMNVKEIAIYLRVSKETIYRLLKSNKIPHHRIGKTIIFDCDEIDKWVKK